MSFAVRIILVFVILLLLEFYFVKKFLNSLRGIFASLRNKKFRKIKIPLLIFLNLYPFVLLGQFIYFVLINDMGIYPPENFFYDYLLVYPFWIFILIMIQSLIYILILDMLRVVFYPLYKKRKEKILPILHRLVFVIVIFSVVYVPIRVLYDYNTVSVRVTEYSKKGLADDLKNLKITFISDLQADRYTDSERLQNFINKVNSTSPDLVLMAGDVITSTPDYIDTAAVYLGKIKSKYGIYSCIGDHDNWAYRDNTPRSLREVTAALKKHGITMIDNDTLTIPLGKAKIGITFITNTYVKSVDQQTLYSLADSHKNADLKIFLTHQPRQRLIQAAIENNYDLILAGHTHGGQITFLFPFINLSPTLAETRYVRGDFHIGDMMLIVTRGLGMSLVPLRFNSTPEITVLILKDG